MIAKNRMKMHGKWYKAGEEIPSAKAMEDEVATNEVKESKYNKTEINRMSTADLKKLAKSEGIKKVEDMSGADLKKVLIEKFGL